MSSTVKQAVSELSVSVPWGEIRGKAWGPDHGRPVLCLHGWSDNCGTFNTLIPLLPKDYRYVMFDFAGHGLSSHRPPGVFYTLPAHVADIRRVVDDLQWTKFSIIGHSVGGNAAAMFSALFPEMVDAVVLLDTFGFVPLNKTEIPGLLRRGLDEMTQFEKIKEQKTKVYTYEEAVERLLAANPNLPLQSAQILLERGLIQLERGFVFSRDIRINFMNIARYSLEQCLEMQSQIQAPLLLILADKGNGKPLSEYHASTILQGYRERNNTVVTVSGDHYVHLNDPEVVAPLVSNFLQTQQLPA